MLAQYKLLRKQMTVCPAGVILMIFLRWRVNFVMRTMLEKSPQHPHIIIRVVKDVSRKCEADYNCLV